jgi:hypothetical protein
MADEKQKGKLLPPPEPPRDEEARQAVREYADQQRAIIKKLRRKMN